MSIPSRTANTLIWTMLGLMYALSGEPWLAGSAVVVMGLTEGMLADEVR